jgi:hypothetical protein
MLVISTATFALGLIALVLETSLAFQQFAHELGSSSGSLWSPRRTNVIATICTTITYFVVSIPSRRRTEFTLAGAAFASANFFFKKTVHT